MTRQPSPVGQNNIGGPTNAWNQIVIGAVDVAGNDLVAIGRGLNAGNSASSVVIGNSAGNGNGGNSVVVGYAATDNMGEGVAIGRSAICGGGSNVVIGRSFDGQGGGANRNNSVGIGYQGKFYGDDVVTAGYQARAGARSVSIGRGALGAITSATPVYNTAVGYYAGGGVTTGSNNVLVGYQAGNLITTGGDNTIIGFDADVMAAGTASAVSIGYSATTKDFGVSIGKNAFGGSQSIAIGYAAGGSSAGFQTDCVSVGQSAGDNLTTGANYNTLVGSQAGNLLTTGANNTIVGHDSDVDVNSRANTVVLGKGLTSSAEDGSIAIGSGSVLGNVTRVVSGKLTVGGKPLVHEYAAKTALYTVTTADKIIHCTSGTYAVTLLSAVGITGQEFIIKNSGAGTITVDTTSSQTIDGATSVPLAQYESVTVISDGANWIVI